jgi:SAM-dependent methyltransferase
LTSLRLRSGYWLSLCRRLIGLPPRGRNALAAEDLAAALFRAIFDREPDLPWMHAWAAAPHVTGETVERAVRAMITSSEFQTRMLRTLVPEAELPDLTLAMPERYRLEPIPGGALRVHVADTDADIAVLERLIETHRYYDRFGVATPVVDLDKQITAAIVTGLVAGPVAGLGAGSCFELGCFTGPVLSLLAEQGLRVLGTETSHLAFVFARANIRAAMRYGDLLSLPIEDRFDTVLCMDVLEHISPLRLDAYLAKLLSLLDADGYLYVNSPMFGRDATFGMVEAPYLAEWRSVGDASYWRHFPCDGRGWPLHGHLVWASPAWWTQKFAAHGLIRDPVIETAIHRRLGGFFDLTVGRRSLFVLRRAANRNDPEAVAAQVTAALSQVPGIPASEIPAKPG